MRSKKKKTFLVILIIVTLIVILGQSFLPTSVSLSESRFVTEKIVKPLQKILTGEVTVTDSVVRKIAHIVEFFFLGIEMCVLVKRNKFLSALSYCGLAALIDESIQIISKRDSLISDALIDCVGAIAGILLTLLILLIISGGKRKN